MRILHINCNYLGTTLHQQMIQELDKLGIENQVFVPTCNSKQSVIIPNDNVYVSECFRKWDRLLFDYKQSKIIDAIEKHYDISKFDVIHAYTLFTDGNAARVLSEKYGIPYVVAVRNTDINDFFRYRINLRSRGLLNMYCAKRVFFLSPSYRNFMLDKYIPKDKQKSIVEKTYIVPNGIDDFWFENLYTQKEKKDAHHIKEKKLRLIYAGGLDKNKNLSCTLRAIKKLKEDGWNIEFSVIGRIIDKEVYNQVTNTSDCVYYEPVKKEQLIEHYRRSDVFVMPSHTESFGLVYAEAMSQGLPVIYTRGQGFDGQFEDGDVGYAVSDEDDTEVVEAIEKIVSNYEDIVKRCLQKVSKFKWQKLVAKYRAIYEDLIGD